MKRLSLLYVTLLLSGSLSAQFKCTPDDVLAIPNLVANGDFEQGNKKFISDYVYASGSLLDQGKYNVQKNPNTVHFAWEGTDHTSGNGNQMIVNGGPTPLNVWCQTVEVKPNTYYRYAAWFKNIVIKPAYENLPWGAVELRIDGKQVSTNLVLKDYPDEWVNIDTLWFSGNSTSVQLCIYDTSTAGNGNDFSVDDISLKECYECSLSVDAGPDHLICRGDSVVLRATGSVPGGHYNWYPAAGITETDDSITIASPPFTVNYRVKMTYDLCTAYDTVTVDVFNAAVILGPDKSICKGDSVLLSLLSTGSGDFAWMPVTGLRDPLANQTYAMPAVTTTYAATVSKGACSVTDSITITVTNVSANAGPDKTFCKGESAILSATGQGLMYSWSPNKSISNPLFLNPTVFPDTTTTYTLTVRDGTCEATDSMTAFITIVRAEILNNDTIVCKNDSVQLRTFIKGDSFTWTPHDHMSDPASEEPLVFPQDGETYRLTVTSGTCHATDTFIVHPSFSLTVDAGPDVSICKGESAYLEGTSGYVSYLWSPSSSLNDSTIRNPVATPHSTTQYILQVTSGACSEYDTMQVSVMPLPEVDAGPDRIICDDPVVLGISSSGADQFSWSPSQGLSDATIFQPAAFTTSSATYIVEATHTASGCKSADTVSIYSRKPFAAFSSDPETGLAPLHVQFTNSSNLATRYLWSFHDPGNHQSQLENPSFDFLQEGSYHVMLVVSNDDNCYDTAETDILIVGQLRIFIPNVFTPDGDGLNDDFVIVYAPVESLKLMRGSIWDRWGTKLYEFQMPGGKWWNGIYRTKPATGDVYVYMIEAEDLSGRVQTFSGNVTLMR